MYVLEEMNDFSLKSIGFNLDQMYSRIFVAGKYTKDKVSAKFLNEYYISWFSKDNI